jgi:hypothetical protein
VAAAQYRSYANEHQSRMDDSAVEMNVGGRPAEVIVGQFGKPATATIEASYAAGQRNAFTGYAENLQLTPESAAERSKRGRDGIEDAGALMGAEKTSEAGLRPDPKAEEQHQQDRMDQGFAQNTGNTGQATEQQRLQKLSEHQRHLAASMNHRPTGMG